MAHTLPTESLSEHQRAIRTAYAVLATGLLLMIAINAVAYLMFRLINEQYRSQDRALVNCKLEATNAHMLFQEIMAGNAAQDMNEVWQKLRRAKGHAEVACAAGAGRDILSRLDVYRMSLLAVNARIQRDTDAPSVADELPPAPPVEGEGESGEGEGGEAPGETVVPAVILSVDELWQMAVSSYGSLFQSLDAVEGDFSARMAGKMRVVNLLYALLFVVMLGLFGVLVYSIRGYVGERRRAEAELAESRDALATIFDALNAVVLVVDPQGMILRCNQAAARYFGWRGDAVHGLDLWAQVPWLAGYQQRLSTVFYSGHPLELHRERLAIGSTERALDISMRAAPALGGVVLRIDDVTMQAVQEVHARQAQQMHLLRNLVRSLANDFNNVLGAIGGTVSLLRLSTPREVAEGEEFAGHLATMEAAMERAAMMVRQMSSLAGDTESALLQPMDMGERLRHVLNVVRNNLPQGVQLRAELPKGRALVKGNDRLVEQVLINLIDNGVAAIREAQAGGGVEGGMLTVQLDQVVPDHAFRARQPQATQASYWEIRVGDSGVGMTPERVARIFEPFYTTRTVTRSAGLGLALVAEMVERMGGFIEVRSAPGQGSIFSVFIPELSDAAEFLMREAAVAEAAVVADGGIPMGNGLVLVVDDEPVMRKTAANILAKLGYSVITAEGGREAVALFQERHADIVLVMLDLAMPEMGGKETFLALREINQTVPALMASGYQQDELVEEALNLGVAGFIRKPYRLSTLAQEIDRIRRLTASR